MTNAAHPSNGLDAGNTLSPEDLQRDRRMEILLDEMVTVRSISLPEDFSARVLAARPFAPWEVRRRTSWRMPVFFGAAFLVSSLAIGLAPLWSLGTSTAILTWVRLLQVALSGPVEAAVQMGPALAEAFSQAAHAAPLPYVAGGFALAAFGALSAILAVRSARVAASTR
jgi:hypothetical protein